MNAVAPMTASIEPFSLKDAPSLIERLWPAQKISAEAQKERKAGSGQTLTALGSYWKGRKPLVLVRACILGALLPATDDPAEDLAVFEMLMRIDDAAFLERNISLPSTDIAELVVKANSGVMDTSFLRAHFNILPKGVKQGKPEPATTDDEFLEAYADQRVFLSRELGAETRDRILTTAISQVPYVERVRVSLRPEELPGSAWDSIWPRVNQHLGTSADSVASLVEQLGIMRFGHRPRVADTFAGGGSIPFEAARMGCDVFASDLNPVACMLTWGALNVIGGHPNEARIIQREQSKVAATVDAEIERLGIEQDADGNRAKAFLYCVETRCPSSGWMVPVLPNLIISKLKRVVAQLIPDPACKRYDISIRTGVGSDELKAAEIGTLRAGFLTHVVDGVEHRTSIKSIRGDYRDTSGSNANRLRRWDVRDFKPSSEDIYQERLYCIHWISADTLGKGRQDTFFAAPTEADLERETTVIREVASNIEDWQNSGLVPDMPIEPGYNTDQPMRERGWSYWHHLFSPRQIWMIAKIQEASNSPVNRMMIPAIANLQSKLCAWHNDGRKGGLQNTFSNQALNTLWNYGSRGFIDIEPYICKEFPHERTNGRSIIQSADAKSISEMSDIYVTDPPYADAVHYHEITEFFIGWLRKNPPAPFDEWIWDSRRPLAIKGDGEEFRREMMAAYKAMADHMPDNGVQVVMFTHQSGAVWADMAQIFWGAGLQVQAAWYIATETTSELKKGGYVQGTVILVLRKRLNGLTGFGDEIAQLVRSEVANQIDNLVGLNQSMKGAGRVENLFEDADLQMAGYAAALHVLTGYTSIDGRDMTAEALRPRAKGQNTYVDEIIEFAVQVANEHMVPEGLTPQLWERLSSSERFYLKMLDVEGDGISKLDNYQNFARAFRVADYASLMGGMQPNAARIKTAADFKKSDFTSEFGQSATRALLYAIWQISEDVEVDVAHTQLRELVPDYGRRRDDLVQLAQYVASRRDGTISPEPRAAKIVANLIRNERL